MNNKRWLTCDAVMVFMIVVLIAIMLSLFVVTIVGAEELGNGVFPLQCIEFQPGRTFDWIGACPFLPMIYNGTGLNPMPAGR